MAMSKRHFEKLAKILREQSEHAANNCPEGLYREGRKDSIEWLRDAIADMCCEENPRFDRARFLAACEPK